MSAPLVAAATLLLNSGALVYCCGSTVCRYIPWTHPQNLGVSCRWNPKSELQRAMQVDAFAAALLRAGYREMRHDLSWAEFEIAATELQRCRDARPMSFSVDVPLEINEDVINNALQLQEPSDKTDDEEVFWRTWHSLLDKLEDSKFSLLRPREYSIDITNMEAHIGSFDRDSLHAEICSIETRIAQSESALVYLRAHYKDEEPGLAARVLALKKGREQARSVIENWRTQWRQRWQDTSTSTEDAAKQLFKVGAVI